MKTFLLVLIVLNIGCVHGPVNPNYKAFRDWNDTKRCTATSTVIGNTIYTNETCN